MARAARGSKVRRSRGNSVSVNWGEAELNNFVNRPGVYAFKVTAAEEGDDGQIITTSEVTSEGKQEGKSIKTYFNTTPTALWVLAHFLEAVGMDIPDAESDLDLDELVGKEYVAEVEANEYEGKTRLRISGRSYDSIDALEDDTEAKAGRGAKDEEEEEAPKGRRSRKAVKDEDDEEEAKPARGKKTVKKVEPEKFDRAVIEEMDRDDLIEFVSDNELDVDPDDFKKLPKFLAAVIAELEEKDLLEEAEEEAVEEEETKPARRGRKAAKEEADEEEEKPARGKKAAKPGKDLPKMTADEVQDMNEEELDDVVDKYDLDCDLGTAKTLRKKAALVLDALEEKDLLDND